MPLPLFPRVPASRPQWSCFARPRSQWHGPTSTCYAARPARPARLTKVACVEGGWRSKRADGGQTHPRTPRHSSGARWRCGGPGAGVSSTFTKPTFAFPWLAPQPPYRIHTRAPRRTTHGAAGGAPAHLAQGPQPPQHPKTAVAQSRSMVTRRHTQQASRGVGAVHLPHPQGVPEPDPPNPKVHHPGSPRLRQGCCANPSMFRTTPGATPCRM